MTAKLYYTARPIDILSGDMAASSSDTGYDVANVATPSIKQQWRATGSGTSEYIRVDLGASVACTLIAVQGCNFTRCTVKADNSAHPSTTVGTMVTYEDRHGTRKGSLVVAATVRYIELDFDTGSPTDGAAYWFVGSLQAYGTALSLPVDPLFGSEFAYDYQDLSTELPNGRRVRAERGSPKALIDLNFRTSASQDIEQLARLARAADCWLDIGATDHRYWQYPVTLRTNAHKRTPQGYNREVVTIGLEEVA